MKPWIIALMMVLSIGTAVEDARATGSEPPESATAAAKPVAAAEPDAKQEKEFRLPPGFKEKKRGKYVLYCKRDAPMGTRLKSEICFDEVQMRDYILALEANKADIDRIRATCSNVCACGQPEAC
jgi:hypothetical protein